MPVWDDAGRFFREHWPFGSSDSGPGQTTPAPTPEPPPPAPTDQSLRPTGDTAAPVMSHWAEPSVRPHHRGPESVVYLGINDASREKEKHAFDHAKNATVLTGSGTNQEMQGKMLAADGKTVLDLGKEADVMRFLSESGVGAQRKNDKGELIESPEDAKKRLATMEDMFLGQKDKDGVRQGGFQPGVRDEMAQFVQVLQKVENGDMSMDRLVMSGHSTGDWVYSEADGNPGVTFAQMQALMGQFPQARGGVEDLMLSACHTLEDSAWGDTRDGKQYQDIFPHLTNVWGYDGTSPSYKQGSTQHIRNWLAASQGNDPSKVANMARHTGQHAAVKKF